MLLSQLLSDILPDSDSQCDKILKLLRKNQAKGRRTERWELGKLGIANPTARIAELRKRGHNIVMHVDKLIMNGGRYKQRFTSYDIG